MSVPVAYTNCKERLASFRKTIIQDLVGGRVIAGLDAGHDSMQKYSRVIQSLSVTPCLFGEVNRSALALKLKGLDVGSGKIRGVQTKFVLGESDYPLKEPMAVPSMKLPQVDIFQFTPFSDINMLEKASSETLKSYILVQAEDGAFEDTPQVENSRYDYYNMYPTRKDKGKWEILSPEHQFVTYKYIIGECYVLFADLLTKGSIERNVYTMFLWQNPTCSDVDGKVVNVPLIFAVVRYAGSVTTSMTLAGQHATVPPNHVSALCYDPTWGYNLIEAGLALDTLPETEIGTWYNTFTATVDVNDVTMGTTTPEPQSKTEIQAEGNFTADALPNSGYVFLHWLRDGTVYSYNTHIVAPMLKDHKFVAVFGSA